TELAALHAGPAEHLAVLLLGHALAALLDHRTHIGVTYLSTNWSWVCLALRLSERLGSRDGTRPDYLQAGARRTWVDSGRRSRAGDGRAARAALSRRRSTRCRGTRVRPWSARGTSAPPGRPGARPSARV